MRDDDFSNFRSAIEWPDMRPKVEEATGELKPISSIMAELAEIWASAATIAPKCESPIEVDLGARLSHALGLIDDSTLLLVPQYILGSYRYDFALSRNGKPIALIECDGREFHSTEEDVANDRAKDALAANEGLLLFRFSGSEIFRDTKECVRIILRTLRLRGHLTQRQWDVVELALPSRAFASY
jgi:very-short-patch-repair endonuclease